MRKMMLFTLATSLGCATVEATPSPPPPVSAPAESTEPTDSVVDHQEIAARFPSAKHCMFEARSRHQFDRADGWQMAAACFARDDFFDLRVVLQRPWIDYLVKAGPLGALLTAQVIDRRGGRIDLDVILARDAGLPFVESNALRSPLAVGQFMFIRGKVIGVQHRSNVLVVDIAEVEIKGEAIRNQDYIQALERTRPNSGWYPRRRHFGAQESRQVLERTQRFIRGSMKPPDEPFDTNATYYFLTRVDRVKEQGQATWVVGPILRAVLAEDFLEASTVDKLDE